MLLFRDLPHACVVGADVSLEAGICLLKDTVHAVTRGDVKRLHLASCTVARTVPPSCSLSKAQSSKDTAKNRQRTANGTTRRVTERCLTILGSGDLRGSPGNYPCCTYEPPLLKKPKLKSILGTSLLGATLPRLCAEYAAACWKAVKIFGGLARLAASSVAECFCCTAASQETPRSTDATSVRLGTVSKVLELQRH